MAGNLPKFAFILWIASSLSGCVSHSSLQTAETLSAGQVGLVVGLGQQQTSKFNKVESSISPAQNKKTLLIPELRVDYGLAHSFQIGGIFASPYGVGLSGKYRICYGFIKCSVGLNYLTSPLTVSGSDGINDDELEIELHDLTIPFYASMRWNWLAPYSTIKYINRNIRNDIRVNLSLIGLDLGIALGNSWGGMIEYSSLFDLGSSFQSKQFSFAFFYDY